ncbi:MAG TPA: hypothetical protein VHG91_01205 [Longimicrobium sp.]|nr:hypothetical protein [Longimicrobium sp.]
MRRFRTAAAALSACALLAACEDSTGSDAANEVRFTYSGAFSGSYDADGDFPGRSRRGDESFSVGVDLEPLFGAGVYGVLGSEALGDGFADVFTITIDNLDEGNYSCGSVQIGNGDCPFDVQLALGYDWDTGFDDIEFELVAGQLRIAEIDGDRIRGTFSATMAEVFDGDIITLQGGTFDVEVRSYSQVVGSTTTQRAPRATLFRD